ncbi:MAG: hypothetical protein PF541_05045 [Prolixibacteraceae bacterium]|jgi:hypothetical protein|nr:hypothetical protein [Prolixibacteraceae bacterium]
MTMYTKDGRLMIPIGNRKKKSINENKIRYIINEAFCPKGCSLIDHEIEINGFPGLRIGFRRPRVEGEFAISAVEGDFKKIVLSGQLEEGVKDELQCPHCKAVFEKLVNCNCKPEGEMIVIGLTPKLNFNNAITFCNVTGCANGTFIKSGEALRHVRLSAM